MKKYLPPILVIVFGLWWLLWELEILPSFGLLLGTGLILSGSVYWWAHGINKGTFTLGGFLILLGILRFLRHLYVIRSFSLELPILVIGLGILMLINRTSIIPEVKAGSVSVCGKNSVDN
jgi:hypothetical protein